VKNKPEPPPDDFTLSRAGWELYHRPRLPRANWPVIQPKLMTRAEYAAETAGTASTLKQGESTMRGMKRLANLTGQLMQQIDAEADAAANELAAAHEDAKAAVGEFRSHAGEVRKVAADIRAQLGQISNMGPTEGSGS
jgi:hypothetical protein